MNKLIGGAIASIALGLTAPATAAETINLDGVANASLNGSNAKQVLLTAGTYQLTFVQGAYTAFNRFSASDGCDASGANCARGFENSARYVIGTNTFGFGDGNADGGIGPLDPGNGYYDTAARSLAAASVYSTRFTLAEGGNVGFYIVDDNLGDNSGGVSLSLAAVPEPATWALMILGFGLVGSAMRRKQATPAFAAA